MASTPAPVHPWPASRRKVTLNRLLDRMTDIAIDETQHGPAGDRRYRYEPTFLLRGLSELHLTYKPVA